ncbi:MAG: hypothetical protein JO295_12740 [Verrucomicrobia bacterium]|nr:hypothetical protein [Verrucomicrobiota bacterium]
MPDARLSDDKTRALLACCRPDGGDEGDKLLRTALQRVEADPELRRDFELQADWDNRVAALVDAVPLPAGLAQRAEAHWIGARRRQFSWRQLFRHPAFLAALLAGNFLIAWGAWMVVAHYNGFAGDENVTQLIDYAWPAPPKADSTPRPKPGTTPEPLPQGRGWLAIQGVSSVGIECGKLGDLLMMRYNFDRYRVPPELAGGTALAYRMIEHRGEPAVEVIVRPAVAKNEAAGGDGEPLPGNLYFFCFRPEGRGVSIDPPDRWKFLSGDPKNWSAAVRLLDGSCFVVACEGKRTELRHRLAAAGLPLEHHAK